MDCEESLDKKGNFTYTVVEQKTKGFERKSSPHKEHREELPWAGSSSVMSADEVHPGAGAVRSRQKPGLAGPVSPALTV